MTGVALVLALLALVAAIVIGGTLLQQRSGDGRGMRRLETTRRRLAGASSSNDRTLRRRRLRAVGREGEVAEGPAVPPAGTGPRARSDESSAGPVDRSGRATDPVCGAVLDPSNTAARLAYRGRTYCFCSTACARAFERGARLWRDE